MPAGPGFLTGRPTLARRPGASARLSQPQPIYDAVHLR